MVVVFFVVSLNGEQWLRLDDPPLQGGGTKTLIPKGAVAHQLCATQQGFGGKVWLQHCEGQMGSSHGHIPPIVGLTPFFMNGSFGIVLPNCLNRWRSSSGRYFL